MTRTRTDRRQLSLIGPPQDIEDSAVRRKRLSAAELFGSQCRLRRLPPFEEEFEFAKSIGRRWRSDFGWRRYGLLVEIEGLSVRRLAGQLIVTGRHASISGFKEDAIKYATAAVLGYTVLRFEQSQVRNHTAINYTVEVLMARGWTGG